MSKVKYDVKFKKEVIDYVLEGHSCNLASNIFNVNNPSTVRKWVNQYHAHGNDGLAVRNHNHTKYDGNFRVHVIEYMRENMLSKLETATMFNIPSSTTITQWEKLYLEKGPAGLYSMGKKRDKNMEEKLPDFPETRDNETLAAENRRLRIEIEYLKKLNALVQKKEASQKGTK